ncbi:MAG TPA: hypothetical protein VEU77_04845 [Candidatus Acidoferrales bacterium]|nr:hypothetical protein [Candidatus Acidoferrales bacterium]
MSLVLALLTLVGTLAPGAEVPECRQPVAKVDQTLVALCPDGATLWVDRALSGDDRAAIAAQIGSDLAAVQTEFKWTLATRPVIYVRASRDGYVDTLERVFGYGAATAEYVADNSVAFFEPSLRIIAVNWAEVRDRRPIAAIRHELTHVVTLEACAPRCDLVPAWFNEGEARLMETTVGAEWRLVRVRYEAESMLATDTLLPLTALWTQAQWNAYGDWLGYYKYQEAARAIELIKEDVGADAIPRLYARLRAGDDLTRAYAVLSGKTWASFTSTLGARITSAVPSPRGIVTIAPGSDGTGISYLVYGFPAEAKISVHIRSHAVDETQDTAVSPQGALFGGIDDTYPQGTYTITAAIGGDTVAAVTVTKHGGRFNRALRD